MWKERIKNTSIDGFPISTKLCKIKKWKQG
jgi:hypothetical protein